MIKYQMAIRDFPTLHWLGLDCSVMGYSDIIPKLSDLQFGKVESARAPELVKPCRRRLNYEWLNLKKKKNPVL